MMHLTQVQQYNAQDGYEPNFERLIQARLNTFLSESNILKERKHGFRTYKGSHTAIPTTCEAIANALTDIKQAYLVLRDVVKALL